ncbi:unnamed protein product [Amoebophrya sp. A25]|nr:unnamed protein product [Amoebophrya sp. A25]|eukprot:GSA25T00022087001.1
MSSSAFSHVPCVRRLTTTAKRLLLVLPLVTSVLGEDINLATSTTTTTASTNTRENIKIQKAKNHIGTTTFSREQNVEIDTNTKSQIDVTHKQQDKGRAISIAYHDCSSGGDAAKINRVKVSPAKPLTGQEITLDIEGTFNGVDVAKGSTLEVKGKEGWFVHFDHVFDFCSPTDYDLPMGMGDFHLAPVHCSSSSSVSRNSTSTTSTGTSTSSTAPFSSTTAGQQHERRSSLPAMFSSTVNLLEDSKKGTTTSNSDEQKKDERQYKFSMRGTVSDAIGTIASSLTVWVYPRQATGEEINCLQFDLQLHDEKETPAPNDTSATQSDTSARTQNDTNATQNKEVQLFPILWI